MANDIVSHGKYEINNRISYYINKLVNDTISLALKRIDTHFKNDTLDNENIKQEINISFSSTSYRTNLIYNSELKRSYIYGSLLGTRFNGGYGIQLKAAENSCDKCKKMHNQIIPSSIASIDDIPPFHPNSRINFIQVLQNNKNG
jgi:hypothetical protein